jgi:hypothetical protein
MHLHQLAVLQPKKMLKNVAAWLDKAAAHAKAKSYDANNLLVARLAPDQFSLLKQVQTACDNAKFIAARLTGATAPAHPDDEKTFEEISARIHTVIAYLDGFDARAFDGAEERKVSLPFLPKGSWLSAEDYLVEFALPNFYFHVTTAYAILRHNGVELGKMDFIGGINLQNA